MANGQEKTKDKPLERGLDVLGNVHLVVGIGALAVGLAVLGTYEVANGILHKGLKSHLKNNRLRRSGTKA